MSNYTPGIELSTEELRSAVVAGISILIMAVAGGVAYSYAHPVLHIAHDAEATATAIAERPMLLRFTIMLWCVVAVLDLVVTLAIFRTYGRLASQPAHEAAWLRLLYSVILVVAVAHLVPLSLDGEVSTGLQRFEAFNRVWSGGLVVFGAHLIALAQLVRVAQLPYPPTASLLVLGGVGYIVLEGAEFFAVEHLAIPRIVEAALGVPMILGEMLFAMLLIAARWSRGAPRQRLTARLQGKRSQSVFAP